MHNLCLVSLLGLAVTKIETDSYIGVQLIEQNGDLSFDSLRKMAEDVSGNFTFTILDTENSLYIIKGSSIERMWIASLSV